MKGEMEIVFYCNERRDDKITIKNSNVNNNFCLITLEEGNDCNGVYLTKKKFIELFNTLETYLTDTEKILYKGVKID